MQLADKLQIKSIAPRYKIIDETNCLEVLTHSDDLVSREKAMTLTLDNFKTVNIDCIKSVKIFGISCIFISISVVQNPKFPQSPGLCLS